MNIKDFLNRFKIKEKPATLDDVFHDIDENYKKYTCSSGSSYYRTGDLKVRVSNHFKKEISTDTNNDVNIIIPYGSPGYLVLLSKSLYPVYIDDTVQLAELLMYEKFRREKFFPRDAADSLKDDEETEQNVINDLAPVISVSDTGAPWETEWPLGPESAERMKEHMTEREKFAGVSNVSDFIMGVLRRNQKGQCIAGSIVSIAYREAGKDYPKNGYKQYKDFTGSYKELVYALGEPEKHYQYINK